MEKCNLMDTIFCMQPSLLDFNKKKLAFPEEAVHVGGKGYFESISESFYVIVQGAAPCLFLGVTEGFMNREYPRTFAFHQETGTFNTVQVFDNFVRKLYSLLVSF